MQGYNTIAAVGGGKGLRVVSTLGVGLSVPSVALTCSSRVCRSHRLINRQLQCVHTGASIIVGVGIRIGAALAVRLPVPSVCFAGAFRLHIVRADARGAATSGGSGVFQAADGQTMILSKIACPGHSGRVVLGEHIPSPSGSTCVFVLSGRTEVQTYAEMVKGAIIKTCRHGRKTCKIVG